MKGSRYKSASKTQVSQAYNITIRTLKLWLEPIGNHIGSYQGQAFTPKQVKMIVEFLGEPENIEMISV